MKFIFSTKGWQKSVILITLLLILSSAIIISIINIKSKQIIQNRAALEQPLPLSERVESLKQSVINYKDQPDTDKSKANNLQDIINTATAIKDELLLVLYEKSPMEFRNTVENTYPRELVAEFNTELPKELDNEDLFPKYDQQITGVETDITVDDLDHSKGTTLPYFITEDGKEYETYATDGSVIYPTNSKETKQGMVFADTFIIDNNNGPSASNLSVPSLIKTTGDIHPGVIMTYFEDAPNITPFPPFSKSQVAEVLFSHDKRDSLYNYIKEASYEQTNIIGSESDIYGWLPVKSDEKITCKTDLVERFREIDSFLFSYIFRSSQKVAQLINTPEFAKFALEHDTVIFILPSIKSCRLNKPFESGFAIAKPLGSVLGGPSYIFLIGNISTGLLAHEFGHVWGLPTHANGIKCKRYNQDTPAKCDNFEYADPFDVMGSSIGHYNAYNKKKLGWLPDPQLAVNNNGSKDYDILPLEMKPPSSTQGLKVDTPDGKHFYYLEYRYPVNNFDALTPMEKDNPGAVFIRQLLPSVPTFTEQPSDIKLSILDNFNLYSTSIIDPFGLTGHPDWNKIKELYPANFNNSYLQDGMSFFDPYNKLKITQLMHDASKAKVRVEYNASPPPTPTPFNCLDPELQNFDKCTDAQLKKLKNCSWRADCNRCVFNDTDPAIACK